MNDKESPSDAGNVAFKFPNEGDVALRPLDIHRVFNMYRTRKYLLHMLMSMGKGDLPSYRILEVGCGGGEQLRFLAENRADPAKCCGFDISHRAIKLCRRLSPPAMNFMRASVLDIPFASDSFDIVLCFSVFDCFCRHEDHVRIRRELRRVMKGDGVLIVLEITEDFRECYSKEMNRIFFSFDTRKNELETLLSSDFTPFFRKPVFNGEGYTMLVARDKPSAWVQPQYLHFVEAEMEQGKYSMCYCLYSFRPTKTG